MKTKDRVPGLRVSLVRDIGAEVEQKLADCASAAATIARQFIPAGEEREHFLAIFLDARRNVKGVSVISVGTLSASLVHPREVFRPAIVAGAAAVIVAHDHPSGDVTPSSEDRDAVRRLQRAGELLGVPLADSLIVTTDGGTKYFSWRETGAL